MLKRGGVLISYVDQNAPDQYAIHDHRGAEALKTMRSEMQSRGFKIEREEKWDGKKSARPLPQNWGGTVVFAARKKAE